MLRRPAPELIVVGGGGVGLAPGRATCTNPPLLQPCSPDLNAIEQVFANRNT